MTTTLRIRELRVVRPGPNGEHIESGELNYWFFCPGCEQAHRYAVQAPAGKPSWTFDGNLQSPTFTPSLLMRSTYGPQNEPQVCHLFLTGGQLQFLADCTHALAGKTVPLPELPDWLRS